MKPLFTCLLFLCYFSLFSQNPVNPPNAQLEQWTTLPGYEEPVGWQTLNVLVGLLAPATVSKSTNAMQGTYAARLETKQFATFTIPGLMYLGTFNLSQGLNGAKYGIPFSGDNPISFKGAYQYTSVNGDSAAIAAQLWGRNPLTGLRDTVAQAAFAISQTNSEYAVFDIPFDYYNNILPDSMSVVLVSSAGTGGGSAGQIGSVLLVDDLSFSYNTGIEEPLFVPLEHRAYIAEQNLVVLTNPDLNAAYTIALYDIRGTIVGQWQFDHHRFETTLPDLPKGTYIYQLIDHSQMKQVRGTLIK